MRVKVEVAKWKGGILIPKYETEYEVDKLDYCGISILQILKIQIILDQHDYKQFETTRYKPIYLSIISFEVFESFCHRKKVLKKVGKNEKKSTKS